MAHSDPSQHYEGSEKGRVYHANYRATRREKARLYAKNYRISNPERVTKSIAASRAAKPEKYRELGRHSKARQIAGTAAAPFLRLGYPHRSLRLHLLARSRIHPVTGCWEWQFTLNQGYARMAWNGKSAMLAHRMAYKCFRGPIPDGLPLDHLCRNRRCINPDHLEIVTVAENNRRRYAAARRTTEEKSHGR